MVHQREVVPLRRIRGFRACLLFESAAAVKVLLRSEWIHVWRCEKSCAQREDVAPTRRSPTDARTRRIDSPQYHHETSDAGGNGVGTDVGAMNTGRPASSTPPSPAAPSIPAAARVWRVSVGTGSFVIHRVLATSTTPPSPPPLISCVPRRELQARGHRPVNYSLLCSGN